MSGGSQLVRKAFLMIATQSVLEQDRLFPLIDPSE